MLFDMFFALQDDDWENVKSKLKDVSTSNFNKK